MFRAFNFLENSDERGNFSVVKLPLSLLKLNFGVLKLNFRLVKLVYSNPQHLTPNT